MRWAVARWPDGPWTPFRSPRRLDRSQGGPPVKGNKRSKPSPGALPIRPRRRILAPGRPGKRPCLDRASPHDHERKRASDGRAVMAGVYRRRAGRLFAYWRSEQRTLRQGFVALLISSGGDLLAGLALASMSNRLALLPGLLILIPAAIGMRGNVFGALG